jgi:predicted MPP superfamily phosphohydrolase
MKGLEDLHSHRAKKRWPTMRRPFDPRDGDIENDWSSTKSRSLLSLAGSLVVEVSLPKLALAWLLLIVIPAVMLGLTPLVLSVWVRRISAAATSALSSLWFLLIFAVLVLFGWVGWRTLFRLAESSFWSMNSLAVQPGYVVCREVLQHMIEAVIRRRDAQRDIARTRAVTAAVAGLIMCGLGILMLMLAWPASHWAFDISSFAGWQRLIGTALANSVVIAGAYLAVISLVWGFADTTMSQPRNFNELPTDPGEGRVWRIAHLSDIHVVGERYGFRIESGRSGPRGNHRLRQVMERLETFCDNDPLDAILITGDMTDAGRSAEWAEFQDVLASHPRLAERLFILPGNHDVNIIDPANPARLDIPTSPKKRLRKLRTLSAMTAVQGRRVRVVDFEKKRLGESLTEAVEPYLADMETFADAAQPYIFKDLTDLWAKVFPMVVPPDCSDGLGIILLNSNADTHFSFTNALGMISTEQVRGIEIAAAQYPQAHWVIALHHHLVEYPTGGHKLSDRIGTALINGNWFLRRLHPLADRAVVMHGHRHIDWTGECDGLVIVSAPSPVMEAVDDCTTYFYIERFTAGDNGQLRLLSPQRVTIEGQSPADSSDDRATAIAS